MYEGLTSYSQSTFAYADQRILPLDISSGYRNLIINCVIKAARYCTGKGQHLIVFIVQ